jgi:hypothetical protein
MAEAIVLVLLHADSASVFADDAAANTFDGEQVGICLIWTSATSVIIPSSIMHH